ncbi:hypothetical protein [Amycolatopsis sp. SID8362]|uniref:hypothetical protein n=1 Tax=Amycolatopsis sp. SID8362 TaxID=2690346 RepID=UPI00136FA04C|nr:hypothetical protein [Amycolatopsis sp. SID8362]NBH02563.1 hypothetical protein [Amycolatopsis sp. SID8362]NED39265.1 hypothetical protein [Amycolatopsis sp. SID8362]
MPLRALAVATVAVTVAGLVVSGAGAAPAAEVHSSGGAGTHPTHRACGVPAAHQASCHAVFRTDETTSRLAPNSVPAGYGPAELQSAYRLPVTLGGRGRTVAIVDAYDLPTAESDLNTYRAQYGLPPCTTANGCFRKVNQSGGANPPPADPGWGGEIALDLDMVSASCPSCNILLVEANSAYMKDLGSALNTAVALGAKYVSNSYGGPESAQDANYDAAYFNHSGVAITVSSGDAGFGAEYPASSQYVTAVGGTSLTRSNTPRGWTESAWSGAGSGCSVYDPKPAWQTDGGCAKRTTSDVSAVADPQTGVAVYDSTPLNGQSGWAVVGGTSAGAPFIAGAYALAGLPAAGSYPASYPYRYRTETYDVSSGHNGSCAGSYLCTAVPGYDGPSGLGTPNGTGGLSAGGDPIAQHYNAVGGSGSYLGYPSGAEFPVSTGRRQNYQYGIIDYSSATGAWEVHGAILGRDYALGGPAGLLGFPVTDETGTPDGVGRYNHFANGASIYWTPATGAWSTHGAIRSHWATLGWETGPVGYPTTDETGTPDGIGRYNHFTKGASIYWTPTTGAWGVYGAIRNQWAALGWERSALGYPISDEYAITGGRRSNFQHGYISWNAATGATTVTYT